MKRIILLGASLESDNRGVNALGIGAITILKNSFSDCHISILSVGPKRSRDRKIYVDGKEVNVELLYFPKYDFLKSIMEAKLFKKLKIRPKMGLSQLIKEADHFYDINEGDSFSDIYGSKRIIRHFFDSKLVLTWGKELVFLPQTIGPFKSKLGLFLGKNILKRLKKVYVRDEKAIFFLNSIGVPYELAIDMAVFMAPQEIDSIKIQDKTVGLNINGLMFFNRYGSMKGEYDSYKEFIRKLVTRLKKEGFSVFLIPHTYNSDISNEEDDLQAIKEFLNENGDLKDRVQYLDGDYTAQEIKFVISKLDFFLGSRMHACIGALSKSVPTIGLSYSYKFEGTFKMFGLENHVIELKNFLPEQISPILEEIISKIENRMETRKDLEKLNIRSIPKINIS